MTPRPRPTGPRPSAALPPSEAAIIASLARETRQSTRDLCASTGFSAQVVNQGLHRLRGTGMVAFEDGKDGTIHATFGLVLGPWVQ